MRQISSPLSQTSGSRKRILGSLLLNPRWWHWQRSWRMKPWNQLVPSPRGTGYSIQHNNWSIIMNRPVENWPVFFVSGYNRFKIRSIIERFVYHSEPLFSCIKKWEFFENMEVWMATVKSHGEINAKWSAGANWGDWVRIEIEGSWKWGHNHGKRDTKNHIWAKATWYLSSPTGLTYIYNSGDMIPDRKQRWDSPIDKKGSRALRFWNGAATE